MSTAYRSADPPRFRAAPDVVTAEREVASRAWLGLTPLRFLYAWGALVLLTAPLLWGRVAGIFILLGAAFALFVGRSVAKQLAANAALANVTALIEIDDDGVLVTRQDGGWTRIGWEGVGVPSLRPDALVLWVFDGGAFVISRAALPALEDAYAHVRQRSRCTSLPRPGRGLYAALAVHLLVMLLGIGWLWATEPFAPRFGADFGRSRAAVDAGTR